MADFTVSGDGIDVVSYPVPGVSAATIEHLFLNQVFPLSLSRQFKLVLHAGAVEIGDGVAAFLGSSGRGKSTLTAFFATHGFRFLTDDGLQLEKDVTGYSVKPGYHSIRLWEDSRNALMSAAANVAPPVEYTPKMRLLAGKDIAYSAEKQSLKAMYFLGGGQTDKISIDELSDRDALIELVRHSFLLDIEEREMLEHHFYALTELVASTKFFRLDYPRQYNLLPQVMQAIVRHLDSFELARFDVTDCK